MSVSALNVAHLQITNKASVCSGEPQRILKLAADKSASLTVTAAALYSNLLAAILQQVRSCSHNAFCQVFTHKAASTSVLAEIGRVQLSQMPQRVLELLLITPLSLWVQH